VIGEELLDAGDFDAVDAVAHGSVAKGGLCARSAPEATPGSPEEA
jgi:hypothetical protein